MSFRKFLNCLFGQKKKPKNRHRPKVEILEDRCTPAQVHWIGGGLGLPGGIVIDAHDWNEGANWVGGRVPDINDDVFIPATRAATPLNPYYWPNIDDGESYAVHSINSLPMVEGDLAKARLEIDFDAHLSIVSGESNWDGDFIGEIANAIWQREGYLHLFDTTFNWYGGDMKLQGLDMQGATLNAMKDAYRFSVSDTYMGDSEEVEGGTSHFNIGRPVDDPNALTRNLSITEFTIIDEEIAAVGPSKPHSIIWIGGSSDLNFLQGDAGNDYSAGGLVAPHYNWSEYNYNWGLLKGNWIVNMTEDSKINVDAGSFNSGIALEPRIINNGMMDIKEDSAFRTSMVNSGYETQ